MAEQNALFAMDISDRAYVIDKGRSFTKAVWMS